MSAAPILKGSQAEQAEREQERADRAVQLERRRWWDLEESARRCIAISEHLWDGRLAAAMKVQQELAVTMRDRTAPGVRATGKEYEQDRHVPVPLFTPRDRLQFLKEFAVTLLISARQNGLPVTPEATREAEQTVAAVAHEAGSGVDETLEPEAEGLAQAGESLVQDNAFEGALGGIAVSEAPAS